jgi:predicted Zn-dependent peptidase
MHRTALAWSFSLCFVCCLAAGSFVHGQTAKTAGPAQVSAHPKYLKYAPLTYTPPKAAAYRQTLANGAVGFFVEDHDLPLVNISITIRTGSYMDPAGKPGLAAATANQMRAGGTAHYKADAFDEEADFLAAEISSGAGAASASAAINFMAKDTAKSLELFFDMLRNPAFQKDRIDLLKSQQLQAIERRNDRTDEIEGREWNRLMRGEKHFTSILSTKDSIQSITREDLIEFHKKYYHPSNFLFAVSGDFKTADMKALLDKEMANWPDSGPVPGVYFVNKPDVNQARVSIGHLGIVRGNPDEFAIDMMNDLLGGSGFTSRIFNRVRTDEGLAYDAGSSFSSGVYYEGLFRAAFQSKSATAAQAAQIVLDEIEGMRNTKVSAEDLATMKNQAIEVFPRYFASARAIAGTFANDEFTNRDPKFWETYRDKIKAVTVDDVQRVAREYLHPDKLAILVVGNTDDVLKGNSEKPDFSFKKMAGGKIVRIPLPDPATMVYPKN